MGNGRKCVRVLKGMKQKYCQSDFLFPEGQKFITVSYERCLSGDIMNITVQRVRF